MPFQLGRTPACGFGLLGKWTASVLVTLSIYCRGARGRLGLCAVESALLDPQPAR